MVFKYWLEWLFGCKTPSHQSLYTVFIRKGSNAKPGKVADGARELTVKEISTIVFASGMLGTSKL